MQVTEISNEGLKRQFKITVPATDISQQVDQRLGELGRTLRLPGFRPGKVPVSLVKKQYGQAVLGEILEKTVNTSSQKAIDERGLRPAVQPKVEVTKFAEGDDLEFSVDVEVLPEIEPVDFASIELERLKVAVDEAKVDETLERIAKQSRETKPKEEGQPAANGDTVVLDFVGKVDGKPFAGGSATDYQLELGSQSFIPGFEDQLVGAKAGEARDVQVTFPAEYGVAELAGKPAVFECKIKEVRETLPRAVDDALAKDNGFESLDAMKEAIRSRMEQEYNQLGRLKMKRQLLDTLAERSQFAVPEGLVETEFNAIWERHQEAKKGAQPGGEAAEGAAADKPEGEAEDEEAQKRDYRDIAIRRVRLGLLLAEIGRINNIEVTQDELNRAMIREAQRFPGQEQQVFEFFRKNPQAQGALRAPIFEDKTVDFIFELAKISERTVTHEELIRLVDEEDTKTAA